MRADEDDPVSNDLGLEAFERLPASARARCHLERTGLPELDDLGDDRRRTVRTDAGSDEPASGTLASPSVWRRREARQRPDGGRGSRQAARASAGRVNCGPKKRDPGASRVSVFSGSVGVALERLAVRIGDIVTRTGAGRIHCRGEVVVHPGVLTIAVVPVRIFHLVPDRLDRGRVGVTVPLP